MKLLRAITASALSAGILCASASGWDTILTQTNLPGTPHLVPELSAPVLMSDFLGMEIVAHYCDGFVDVVTLSPGSIRVYPVSSSGWEPFAACAQGRDWSVHVFTFSGTGQLGFSFRGLEGSNICRFDIHAYPTTNLVFDRTNPGPGTWGSDWGSDAAVVPYGYGTGWPGNSDYNIFYTDQIEVPGQPAQMDTFAQMAIEFVGGPHDLDDVVSITVDMDFVGFREGEPDPDPNGGTGPMGDLNGDGRVDGADLAELLGAWRSSDPNADLNGDGIVDGRDLAELLGNWR